MKYITGSVIALLLISCTPLFPSQEEDSLWRYYDLLPGIWSPLGYFESYHPETSVLIEESNGFSLGDRPWVYYDGWSPRGLPWEMNDVSFGSRLTPGAPLGYLPFAVRGGYLPFTSGSGRVGNGGIEMKPYTGGVHSSVSVSTVAADLGSFSPWAQFLITTPATERDELLYETRRRLKNQYNIDGQWCRKWGQNRQLNLALTHNDTSRWFNDWNERDTQFSENSDLTSFYAEYRNDADPGKIRIWALVNRQERDHLGAELGVLPQETLNLDRTSLNLGLNFSRWGWKFSTMLGYEHEKTGTDYPNYTKDLIDSDGSMILSQTPFGSRGSVDFSGRIQPDSDKQIIRPFIDWQLESLNASEKIHEYSPLTIDGQPYGVILWNSDEASKYRNTLYQAKTGLTMNLPLSKSLSLEAKAEFGVNGFSGDTLAGNASLWGLGLHGTVSWDWKERSGLSLTASRFAHPLNGDVVDFLENGRPSGAWHLWDDVDSDLDYNSGEAGKLIRRTGGAYHYLDDDFKIPMVNQIQLALKFPLSRKWSFELKGTGKEINNAWTVRYAEEYGSWREIDDRMIYVTNSAPKAYRLTNLEADRKKPRYWEMMFRFIGEKSEKWYFSFSFMAHMGLGETAFGNGADSNDYLALSESSADPNSWINRYGRLDGDRAFVARLVYALYLSKRFSVGLTAKYRDGNPFAFLSTQVIDDQLVMQQLSLKGEDERGTKLGPREDYLSEINLKLAYRFPLLGGQGTVSLEWFNLVDVGYELSEYVYISTERLPMELNLPRSIRLGFSWRDVRD